MKIVCQVCNEEFEAKSPTESYAELARRNAADAAAKRAAELALPARTGISEISSAAAKIPMFCALRLSP